MTTYTTQQKPLKTSPKQGSVTVYNLITGDAETCAPIDARERVSRGGWSFEPLAMEPELPAVEVSVEGEPVESARKFTPDETTPPKREKKKGR